MLETLPTFAEWRATRPWGIAVFCSHRTKRKERDAVYRALLDWKKYDDIYPLEPTKGHPLHVPDRQIRGQLKRRINDSDVLIVPATMAALHSGYMEWEVRTAKECDVPVLPAQFAWQQLLPRDIIDWCGRNPIPTGLLKARTLEALSEKHRRAFESERLARILGRRAT